MCWRRAAATPWDPTSTACSAARRGRSPDFSYSPGLKATGIVWDAASIDHWITNPRAVVPGTKMSYAGMENAKDRADLIAYLKIKTSQ